MPDDYQESDVSSGTDTLPETTVKSKDEDRQKETGDSRELLPVLRKFILETTKSNVPQAASPSFRQVTGFIVITLDLVLLYLLIPPDWYNNRLFVFTTKLIPWLLGAGFFALSSTIRDWVLERCGKRWFLEVVAVFLVPLTLTQLPIFSVRARVVPPSAEVSAVEHSGDQRKEIKLHRKGDNVRVFFSGLNANKVKVTDGDSEASLEFVVNFSLTDILRGTLAQTPLLGRVLARPLRLTPLYLLPLHASRGTPMVHIEGDFPQSFLQSMRMPESPQSLLKCDTHKTSSGYFALDCPFNLNEHALLPLPPGVYDFTQEQGGCSKTAKDTHLGHEMVNKIDFDALACDK